MTLVLSIFPGIGLLDRAFEEEGFCVVRGPDLLWGGDIKRFHVPAGVFGGIIGGPPCQRFSQFAPLILKSGGTLAEDLIPEFVRIIKEAQPNWFLMENVKAAPIPEVYGYKVHAPLFDNRWIGGEQRRLHRFSFGTRGGSRLQTGAFEVALENPAVSRRACAHGAWRPRLDRNGRAQRSRASQYGYRSAAVFREYARLQGLPSDFDLPGFTVEAKIRALGNAVPLPMGRVIARAVRAALDQRAESTVA